MELVVEINRVLAEVRSFLLLLLGWSEKTRLHLSEPRIRLNLSDVVRTEAHRLRSGSSAGLLAYLGLGPLLELIGQVWRRFTKLLLQNGEKSSFL